MLEELWKLGKQFLGSKVSIMGGAMSWISESKLVAAISDAGGFGVIACSAMSSDMLRAEILKTFAATTNPFGVNIIVIHPELEALIDVCIETRVSHVVFAGGLPTQALLDKLHANNIKSMCFAPSLSVAKRLVRMGVGGLIIEGMEAGGHIGPVSTSVLAQEILPHMKGVPIFVAGGIGRGEAVASFLQMGASGCQIGTLFACSTESIAHKNFKDVLVRSVARDAIASIQLSPDFPVIPVRAIHNKASDEFLELQKSVIERYQRGEVSKKDGQLLIEKFWAGALRRAVIDGDVERGSLMSGQSVGMVTSIRPVQEIIKQLIAEAESYLMSNRHLSPAV